MLTPKSGDNRTAPRRRSSPGVSIARRRSSISSASGESKRFSRLCRTAGILISERACCTRSASRLDRTSTATSPASSARPEIRALPSLPASSKREISAVTAWRIRKVARFFATGFALPFSSGGITHSCKGASSALSVQEMVNSSLFSTGAAPESAKEMAS
ncbi:MAG: hypothetical protein A4E66_01686 [Syntrophus sp. PtaB.Bin001]|nr:MAG: hypothetical protein A4E66_01686 [Syntrophus sp. PtaB.Bin001]